MSHFCRPSRGSLLLPQFQARQGRQIVAHGDSRGEEQRSQLYFEPRQGRHSPSPWLTISVAPAGALFSLDFFIPWLSPWATFYRRYAANYRRLPSGETRC